MKSTREPCATVIWFADRAPDGLMVSWFGFVGGDVGVLDGLLLPPPHPPTALAMKTIASRDGHRAIPRRGCIRLVLVDVRDAERIARVECEPPAFDSASHRGAEVDRLDLAADVDLLGRSAERRARARAQLERGRRAGGSVERPLPHALLHASKHRNVQIVDRFRGRDT